MIDFADFKKLDIRVGTIKKAVRHPKARNPAYVLEIDFGEELGMKTSSAQIVDNYDPSNLEEKQIAAVVNFAAKNIGDVSSEVLVLGAVPESGRVVLLEPDQKVANGTKIA